MLFVKKAIQLENKTTVAQKKMKHTYVTLHVPFFSVPPVHIYDQRWRKIRRTDVGINPGTKYKCITFALGLPYTLTCSFYFRAMLRIARTFMSKDLKEQGGQMSKCLKFCPGVWNLKPIFTQKWESVYMNWGGSTPSPPTILTLPSVHPSVTFRHGHRHRRP